MHALESIATAEVTPEVASESVDNRAAVAPGAFRANRVFLLYAAFGFVVVLPAFLLLVSGLGESRLPVTKAKAGTNVPVSAAVARVPAPR